MTVCAAPSYLAAWGAPESLADLPAHRGVTYARAGRVKGWEFPRPDGSIIEATPPSRLRFDDLEAIADAAEAGHGLACLPCWLVGGRIGAGLLVPVLTEEPKPTFSVHALWPAGPHLPLRVRLAIDALAAELPNRTAR